MGKVRWLLAGAGDIANSRVADALATAEGSVLAAVCDAVPAKADALAARFGVGEVYYDYAEALARADVDAVYIATPHHCHVAMGIDALAGGKHLLCEKPLGINAAECLTLLDAVRASDRVACCSNYRLFTNQCKTTRRLIAEGVLGRLVGGWMHDEETYYNPGGTPFLKSLGMSPINGYGFYLINIAQTLFGMPEAVFARMTGFNAAGLPDYDIDDLETLLLCFPGGAQFSILINNVARAPLRHAYSFYGTKGRIHWPYCPPHFNRPVELETVDAPGPVEDSITGPTLNAQVNWHRPMVEDFVRAVRDNAEPLCTIESATKTAVITEALVASAATGAMQPVIWKE